MTFEQAIEIAVTEDGQPALGAVPALEQRQPREGLGAPAFSGYLDDFRNFEGFICQQG